MQDSAQFAHSLTVGEGFIDPLGFHDATPVFSWKLPAGVKKQTAYQIEVKAEGDDWNSGWVESGQSSFVPYGAGALCSRQRAEWRVRFRDENAREFAWSAPAHFELGLLCAEDWQAQWIRPDAHSDAQKEAVAWLRRDFAVVSQVARARLYVTARGLFELRLDGCRIGDDHFANGWTSYRHRLDTLTYDITAQLHQGNHEIEVTLGTGWYAGRLAWGKKKRGIYGDNPELLLQIEIVYQDGSRQTIVSDRQWTGTYEGPILSSSFYDGENYDARQQITGWKPVIANADLGAAHLRPKPFPPARVTQSLVPLGIHEVEPNRVIFDLGQNIVGWAKLHIPVEKDRVVTIRFAEMLKSDGTLYTENYRSAKSTDTYMAARTETIEWEPHFTFHGFRYVELSGFAPDAKPQPRWVTGQVIHSDLRRIGEFSTSHAKLNQLQSNIVWGQRGNFLDIPTDCPQRDERLGWSGDAQVFCPTAMFNYDCHAFWKSWLNSMRQDQLPDGRIPHIIPDVLREGDSPGWMDAATIVPWEVYVRTGDITVLADNFSMMEKLVAWYRAQSVGGMTPKIGGFGDWLQPGAKTREGDTPCALLGAAFYAHSAQLLANSARALRRDEDAARYGAESASVKAAFARHYFAANGKLQNAPQTQTAYALALAFELVPHDLRPKVAQHLVRLVRAADNHLQTGFLGTPHLVSALEQTGHRDLAFEVLFKPSYPSWFYPIEQGATTMWERWNSYSHEQGFGDAGMNSFNHYAYGAIGQWLYERVAGLAPDPAHPGYRHFFVRPLLPKQLNSAHAELETPYGKAYVAWDKCRGKVSLRVGVPPNTTATIEFPDQRETPTVEAGNYFFQMNAHDITDL